MALVAKRTAAAGGADATQTTAAGVCGVIESLLTTAGWTEIFNYLSAPGSWTASTPYTLGAIISVNSNIYQCIQSGTSTTGSGPSGESQALNDGSVIWRFITSAAGSAKVFQSNGESGNENLYVRIDCNTNSAPSVNLATYQYFDVTAKFGYNRLSAGWAFNAAHHQNYTAGNTVNYVMVANKDAFQVFTNDSANNRRMYGLGRLNRPPGTIATFFTSNATVTAGTNRTFNFSSGDPVAAGYKIGDRVFVVSQQANVSSPFNGLIPLYGAIITALTTSSITIDVAQETTAAGAFIGADPQPLFNWVVNASADAHSASNIFFAYRWINTVPNIWSVPTTDSLGFPNGSTAHGLQSSSAISEIDPNNRTNRVVLGEPLITDSSNNEIAGILPLYYLNPRVTDALWSIGRTNKLPTNYDFVTFPANTGSPSSQVRSVLGPIAISGSSNYTAELYYMDQDTWIEGEFVPSTNHLPDRQFRTPESTPPTQPANSVWVGTLISDTTPDLMMEGVLHENTGTDKVLEGQGSPLRTGGELYPFDTSTTSIGGSGGGFNSGLN